MSGLIRSSLFFSAEISPQSYDSLPDKIKVYRGGLPPPPPPLLPQAVSGIGSSPPAPPTPPFSRVLSEGTEVPLHAPSALSVNSELKEQEPKIWVLHEDPIPPSPPPPPPRLPTPVRRHILKKDPLPPPPLPPRSVPVPDKIEVLKKVSPPPLPPLNLESPAIKKSSPPTNLPPPPQHPAEPPPHTVLSFYFPSTPAPSRPPQLHPLPASDQVLGRAPTPPRPLTMTPQLSVFFFSGAPSTVWMVQHMCEYGCQSGLLSHESFWTPGTIKISSFRWFSLALLPN